MAELTIHRGSTKRFTVRKRLTEVENQDFTGYLARFQVKSSPSGDPLISLDETDGITIDGEEIEVVVPHTDTDDLSVDTRYYAYLEVESPDGDHDLLFELVVKVRGGII